MFVCSLPGRYLFSMAPLEMSWGGAKVFVCSLGPYFLWPPSKCQAEDYDDWFRKVAWNGIHEISCEDRACTCMQMTVGRIRSP